jgi:serine/threonine-protein kinase SMG1
VSSSLLTAKNVSSDAVLFTNSSTRDYFKIIIEIFIKTLSNATSTRDINILTLKWLHEILEILSIENNGFIFEDKLFIKLYNCIITLAYSTEEELCLISNKALTKTLEKFGVKISESILLRILDLCKYFIMNSNMEIRESHIQLLALIPINLLTSNFLTNREQENLSIKDFSIFSPASRNCYIQTSMESIISMPNFKSIISFILNGQLNHNEIYDDTWLQRIFFASQRNVTTTTTTTTNDEKQLAKEIDSSSSARISDNIKIESYVENDDGLLWFWAIWECAQFCVQSKLKTPLGKAQDTFVSIESSIKSYFNYSENSAFASQRSEKIKNIELFRVTLLIQLVECLEKLIYNAYEGTVCLPLFSKPVKLFFRTNKTTCNEWFLRIRYYLINICAKSGHHELLIRQSSEYIQYCMLHNLIHTNEFEQTICLLVKSYVKVFSWQSLYGLHKWLNQTLPKKEAYNWILAAAKEAQGKYFLIYNEIHS